MTSRWSEPIVIAGLCLGVGAAAGGWLAGLGFARGRATERLVTVKGVSEHEVKADKALWPLRLVVADNDLAAAQSKIRNAVSAVHGFLSRQHLDDAQVELQSFSVSDAFTNQERTVAVSSRYVIRQVVMVRSDKPDIVLSASQQVGELVSSGVVLQSGEEYGSGGPTFIFSGLNALKPGMIAEATAHARDAAEQFARDSHSSLGGIHHADQGLFEILPRDQAPGVNESSQIAKTVRVVSTVNFELR